MNSVKRVLIVEDDRAIYPVLTRMIGRMNREVFIEFAASAEDGEWMIRSASQAFDVIVADISLEGTKTGIDLVNECYFNIKSIPCVLTSANRDLDTRIPFLAKPYRYEDFYEKLSPYLASDAPTEEERTGKTRFDPSIWERVAKRLTFVSIALLALAFFAYLGVQMERFPLQ